MRNTLLYLSIGILMAACQPEPDDMKLLDQLVVSTNYEPSASFGSYATFTMPTDTIGFLSNQTRDTILTNGDSELVRPIISGARNNLVQRGYDFVASSEAADLGVNILIVNNLNLFQQVVDPGYYYPSYYGYSSYYYPYVETYVENTGTLVLQILDLKNRTANNQVKVIWSAQMGDVVSTVNRLEQIQEAIDQAFVQSPYLQSNL